MHGSYFRKGGGMPDQEFVDKMVRFESGEMSNNEVIQFFQELLDQGVIPHLQGAYGRAAQSLLDAGLIRPSSDDK